MRMRYRILSSLLLLFAVSACGFVGGNQNTPDGYVRHCIKLLDREALYADQPEWQEAKAALLGEAKTFTTMDQAREAVERAASIAGGKHSALIPPVTDTTSYPEVAPEVRVREGNILHLVLPAHTGVKVSDSLYIHSVLDFLQAHRDARGVIVDLRGNTGGNMGPMIAAVSPLLPDGILLRFKGRKRTTPVFLEGIMMGVGLYTEPIEKFPKATPVAVLTNERTGSSGEATLLCFRGLDNVRTFGAPTAGYASCNVTKFLADGYLLVITNASDVARTGEVFCDDPIAPDVTTNTPLEAAVDWIKAKI